MTNSPSGPVTVERVVWVLASTIVRLAPGAAAPARSVTRPAIEPAPACARTSADAHSSSDRHTGSRTFPRVIVLRDQKSQSNLAHIVYQIDSNRLDKDRVGETST